jgi:hypothetical protein
VKNENNEYEETAEFDFEKKMYSLQNFLYLLDESNLLLDEFYKANKHPNRELSLDAISTQSLSYFSKESRISVVLEEKYTNKASQKQKSLAN